jgi:hypothetical protein
MDEAKNTGIGHDDDGNIDDKRVAGWISFVFAMALAVFAVATSETAESTELVQAFLLAGVGFMVPTVAEKLRKKV